MLPAPQPNAITRPFWEAATRRVLQCPRCDACGHRFFTPQFACPRCLSERWSWSASTGLGTIYSACTVHKPPLPGVSTPYVLAVVSLDEGWNMLTNIVNCEPGQARIGARVKVNWDRRIGDWTIPVFELEGTA